MTHKEKDRFYSNVASLCAQNSKAQRLQVGAILVNDNQIISEGFNGTPAGFDNNCETIKCFDESKCMQPIKELRHCKVCLSKQLVTKPEVLHAESNAILKCARAGRATDGATLYVTHSPCVECAKLIIQAGVKRVVYRELYRKPDGLDLLKQASIKVDQYGEE